MSLSRQLWLTVILVTLISFTGSLSISLISTQSYLEQQLHQKNIDSANSLAHSISQLSKDPITIGLQIAAVFDTGQYETISITSPDGRVIAERVQDQAGTSVPEWFIDLFPISAEAGRAQISDSWMHFGVIKVVSRAQLAHQALWDQAQTQLLWFLAAGLFCGLIGVLILYRIKKPLAAMAEQAEAITERRFLTISEPRIPELRSIARAANDMIRRLHNRAIEETSRLDTLQKQLNYDPVTGLANREYFMNRLAEILRGGDIAPGVAEREVTPGGDGEETSASMNAEITAGSGDEEVAVRIEDGDGSAPDKESEAAIPSPREGASLGENGEAAVSGGIAEAATSSGSGEDAAPHDGADAAPEDTVERKPQSGILFLLRLNNLQEINQNLGRIETNNLLRQVGTLMGHIGAEAAHGETSAPLAARLNGSDFALLVPDIEDASQIARELTKEFAALSSKIGGRITDLCHIGAVRYQRGDQLGELFAKADAALSTAERAGINAWHAIAARPDHPPVPTINIGDWRQIFSDAFGEDRLKLAFYPVAGRTGERLHQEACVRMQAQRDGGWLDASDFVNIAVRLNLTGPLDLAVVRHALESLKSSAGELAVNLSIETVADWGFRNKLTELLGQYSDFCPRLWVEVPEYGAFRKFEALRHFCETLKALGCRTGIEHFGPQADKLQQLTGFGLDYLKIDAAFVHGIHQNKSNQRFLKNLCKLAHNIGIIVIALGVQTEAERKALIKLGFDGVSGPGIQ